jgi:excisionase family DNA binding protein
MLTVPEAARRANRNPETIRRWIRAGRLPARKIGTQHVIEESDLDAALGDADAMAPLPATWKTLPGGRPLPNVVRAVHESRRGR